MPSAQADRNLLFGILALQMDFIGRDQLVEAMQVWVFDKSKSLGEILLDRNALNASRRKLLDSLVDEHAAEHGGIEQSLSRQGADPDAIRALASIADHDLQASLAGFAATGAWQKTAAENAHSHSVLPVVLAQLPMSDESFEVPAELSSISSVKLGDKTVYYFGPYQLHERIGHGGMGIVFRATHTQLKRVCALKMIRSGNLSTAKEIERFKLEAEAAAKLDHPGIVPIFDIGVHLGQNYFAMAYVPGESLSQRVRSGPLEPNLAADLVRQAALAVQHAHERGIVHRDIKPANILLSEDRRTGSSSDQINPADRNTPGTPIQAPGTQNAIPVFPKSAVRSPQSAIAKLTDFGLAKHLDSESGMTKTGEVMGTPSYMSPEQADGKVGAIGPAADVYGLGAVLYHLLTGRPPFQAANSFETIKQVLEKDPVSVRELNAAVSKDLQTICQKCLQKDPTKRYATAADLAADLKRHQSGEPIHARPVGRPERALRWAKRNPTVAGLLATVVFVLAAGIAGTWIYAERANRAAAEKGLEAHRATIQATLADKNQSKAANAQRESERRLYTSDMLLVQSHYEKNELLLMNALLARYDRNYTKGEEPRGFEWHYWNARLHDDLLTLQGHSGGVNCVTFSPDGARLISSSDDKTIKIWNARTGEIQRTLTGHTGAIRTIDSSRNGTRIASGSDDGTINIWDVSNGMLMATLKGHTDKVMGVSFNSDCSLLASCSFDDTIRIWDPKSGVLISTMEVSAQSVAFGPNGSDLASIDDNSEMQIRIWDARGGALRSAMPGHQGSIYCVSFSPDGAWLATGGIDDTIRIWDSRTGTLWATIPANSDGVFSICFSPDGTRLASGGSKIKLWNARTGVLQTELRGHLGSARSVKFSPDGARVASGSDDQTIKIWDARFGAVEDAILRDSAHSDCFGICAKPNGALLASMNDDHSIKVWDVGTGTQRLKLSGHSDSVSVLCFSPDGAQLMSAGKDSSVKIWNMKTGALEITLQGHTSEVNCVAFSADGKMVACGGDDKSIRLWNAHTGALLATIEGHTDAVTSVCFSPDGTRLASCSSDNGIKLWNALSGAIESTLEMPSESASRPNINSISFAPDGTRLAAGRDDGSIKLFDATTGVLQSTLRGHSGAISCVCFSLDGTRLISGSWDKAIKIWEARTGELRVTLQGHAEYLSQVSLSPSGLQLVSVDRGGTIKVWDANTDQQSLDSKRIRRVVLSLFRLPLEQSEIISRLESQPILPDHFKSRAVEIARSIPDHWRRFAEASRNYSLFQTTTAVNRKRAFELAQTACRLSKDHDDALVALAAALFRLGKFKDSAATSLRCKESGDDAELRCIEAMNWKALGREDLAELSIAESNRLGPAVDVENRQAFEREFAEAYNLVLGQDHRGARLSRVEMIAATVKAQFEELLVKDKVRAQIEATTSWSLKEKRIALTALERLGEASLSVEDLNQKSWQIATKSGRPFAEYQRAVRFAEAGVAKDPNDPSVLNTLGVAYYRAAIYDKALATLSKSATLKSKDGVSDPTDLAFWAMTQFKLGKTADAKATLEQCRQSVKHPSHADDADAKKFLAEAEALIGGIRKR